MRMPHVAIVCLLAATGCANELADEAAFGDEVDTGAAALDGSCEPFAGGALEEDSACVTLGGPTRYLRAESGGSDGSYVSTGTTASASMANFARYEINVLEAGRYALSAYASGATATTATYAVTHAGGTSSVSIRQADANRFVRLGVFDFVTGSGQNVVVGDNTGVRGQTLVFDALLVERVSAECARVRVETDGARVNVRPSAATTGTPLGQLQDGDVVDRLETVEGEVVNGSAQWFAVPFGSTEGFIAGALARCVDESVIDPIGPQPGVTDVGALAPGELAALQTGSTEDRRRAAAIVRAQTAYADHMAAGGRVVVSTSPGNNGHAIVTLLAAGFDRSLAADVHTHYHGFNATVADPASHSSGTTARIEELQSESPQLVFVLPECSNAVAGSYSTNWSNVRSQAQTTRDALVAAGVVAVGIRTVSAHSGGGSALQYAMNAQSDGFGVQADRIELQDSLYGSEGSVVTWANKAAGRALQSMIYFRGSNTAGRDARIATAFGARYRRVNVSGPDAHNRCVRDFMGSDP